MKAELLTHASGVYEKRNASLFLRPRRGVRPTPSETKVNKCADIFIRAKIPFVFHSGLFRNVVPFSFIVVCISY